MSRAHAPCHRRAGERHVTNVALGPLFAQRANNCPNAAWGGGSVGGEGAATLQNARNVVARTLEGSTAEERGDWGVMQEKIRQDLKRFLSKETQRRPLIMPVILEV